MEVAVATAQQRWNTLNTGSHGGGELPNAEVPSSPQTFNAVPVQPKLGDQTMEQDMT